MNSPARIIPAFCLAVSFAVPALAADPYPAPGLPGLVTLLPPPPAAGSPADAADLQAVIDAQAHAGAARKARALADSTETVYAMFTGVLGAKFTAGDLPKTTLLFQRIGATESAAVDAAKKLFGRTRPWIAHPEVENIAKPSKSASYPSGHTSRVTADAIVLSAMLPEDRAAIWDRAADYAESRVIGGMHYPTDIEAGFRTGTVIAATLLQQPEFRADMDAAKTELRGVLGLNAAAAE